MKAVYLFSIRKINKPYKVQYRLAASNSPRFSNRIRVPMDKDNFSNPLNGTNPHHFSDSQVP